jgi:hypothetical protein
MLKLLNLIICSMQFQFQLIYILHFKTIYINFKILLISYIILSSYYKL